jgi:hypothetical protein
MTCETPTLLPDNLPALLNALRRNNFDAARTAIADMLPPQLQSIAEGLMRRRRWSDAQWVFSQIEDRDAGTEMKLRLSRNLGSFQAHRSGVYEQLIALGTNESFAIAPSVSGKPTIRVKREDGSMASLSGGHDPLAAAEHAAAQLKAASPHGESLALCGLGDGYLLQLLAQRPPKFFMDMQQAVFVLEPEPQVLLHALMIHDYTGANGAIAAERFRWFIGADWSDAMAVANETQPSVGLPTVTIQQGLDGPAVQQDVQRSVRNLLEQDAVTEREIERYYAGLGPRHFATIFSASPPRKPRVMLLTTRFSTVLQFSTRDTAEAFKELGWDTRIVIELTPSHRLYQHAIRRDLAQFKPDLIFQIDHLRHEHKGMFPANLPFVCWAQDHLEHIITPEAGRRTSALDFVLTDNAIGYAENYAYPARQLITVPKLTKASTHSKTSTSDTKAEDIVFVSNASRTPEQLIQELSGKWDGSKDSLAVIVEAAGQIRDAYEAGGAVSTYGEIRQFVRQAITARGARLSAAETLETSKWLTHPFNDALYRQQAMRWVAAAAGKLGLSVGLYGSGWEAHPEFKKLARGPIAYGEPLRELTQRATINLQIVPYLCLHQRLLDGLVAGGFFLIRENPNDVYPQTLLNFVEHHLGGDVRTTRGVRAGIDPVMLPEFNDLLQQAARGLASTDQEDVVAIVREWASAGLLQTGGDLLPRLPDVSFDSEQRITALLTRYANDPELRNEIAGEQRRAVMGRLSYSAGMARVQRHVAALLSETANSEEFRKCA